LAKGEKNNPIEIIGDRTNGIFINNINKESSISHLNLRNLGNFSDSESELTGALTVYGGHLAINNLSSEDNVSEDAINIANASIEIEDMQVNNSPSDGFDCDFCTGKVENAKFFDIGGDAFDVSGSDLDIRNFNISRVADKGLSIGEASNVKAKNININLASVAIAIKDSSNFESEDVHLTDSIQWDYLLYRKKSIFYKNSSALNRNVFSNKKLKFLCQKGAGSMLVNGLSCNSKNINIKNIYESGYMKK